MRSSPPPAPAAELVPPWLKSLPLAPVFRPTAAEFADPVAYIHKIEAAAAPYGICKVVPPLPPPPKKAALSSLSRSFAALHPDDPSPSFPTRHQQLGLCPRRPRPALKPVWRSSHRYTLPQFESKAAAARKSLLARLNVPASKQLTPLDHEVLFWRASADRPIVVEYGSDMPGSGFSPCAAQPPAAAARAGEHVGETAWNMCGVARSPGSLLQFMREDVPGVTTPMLYVGMMFSWFAWHVEDHELHSLNYMHLGAGKTWYGVPRDAALAFEEVVREHGYSGEVNPLETFATLGRKTTVMSPEVLVDMGIPCCRLVQNAGEFVVTFPGSYHCGFSHGFNCGEASNIATPEWLRIAKEAAIRRASVNCPPMVSHYQLLYELALSMRFREPSSGEMGTRSSRLKDKKKCEGEQLVKRMFIQNVIEDNKLLSHLLNDGSSCIILPSNAYGGPVFSALHSKYQSKLNSGISHDLCNMEEAPEASGCLSLNRNGDTRHCISSDMRNMEGDKGDGLLDQGLLSCVTCGILSFSCVAVLKPRDCTARYLMSADSNSINNQLCISGGSTLADAIINERNGVISRPGSERCCNKKMSDDAEIDRNSALDLLAFAYGGQSDSEEDPLKKILQVAHNSDQLLRGIIESQPKSSSNVGCFGTKLSSSSTESKEIPSSQNARCIGSSVISNGPKGVRTRNKYQLKMVLSEGFQAKDMFSVKEKKVQPEPSSSKGSVKETVDGGTKNDAGYTISVSEHRGSTEDMYSAKDKKVQSESSNLDGTAKETVDVSGTENDARCNSTTISVSEHRGSTPMINSLATSIVKPDKDSSRMHVFCLEHAIEVEKQLHAIGGSHIILLCHPEYPKIEVEARLLAEEMGVRYDWKGIHFKEANMEDRKKIQEVLQDEEAIPTSSDWAVKLGINLYYSANLAKSPLYNKQMPYNRVIYRAFGCNSQNDLPVKLNTCERKQSHQKKIAVAGRWCGKVWTSKQVHPYLAHRVESQEGEEADRICYYRVDEKHKAEPIGNSSRTEASKRKSSSLTDGTESSNRREEIPGEETNTKRPKHSEEDNLRALESAAEVVAPSPAGTVLRISSRIANRAKKLKSKMAEDDGPSNHPKSNIEEKSSHASGQKSNIQEENANSASHLRATPPKQKTEVEAKKQTKIPKAPKQAVEYPCDVDGCSMSFHTKRDLSLHKSDICPVKGCGKKFFSHKYLLQHRKVHTDDRPLTCPWEGCNMAFKWPWARTEHLRVHTGDRPYVCHEPGCAQTFRFVSDFSRHKRKTGHSVKKKKKKAKS
ncbi:lysine-specific demethylase JMJ705-like [Oryza brachyantha]|uniref:JmjC domain-containing protein n=1 Tax=Oryza brachyantha TaxID=4533 RepID=J3L6X6_ORYBR|nr:lysine-specific demethylase JMJ705-like [Oryza brachyantha]